MIMEYVENGLLKNYLDQIRISGGRVLEFRLIVIVIDVVKVNCLEQCYLFESYLKNRSFILWYFKIFCKVYNLFEIYNIKFVGYGVFVRS